jgi:hypothetical protein
MQRRLVKEPGCGTLNAALPRCRRSAAAPSTAPGGCALGMTSLRRRTLRLRTGGKRNAT